MEKEIIPQITTFIAKEKNIDLLNLEWPKAKIGASDKLPLVHSLIEFNSSVWKSKKEKGIPLKNKIIGIKIPKHLLGFEKDIKACHKI
jgi:hypothetical protein